MSRTHMVPFCLLVFLIPALAGSAQSISPKTTWVAPPHSASSVISAHELQIPQRARDAFTKGVKGFAAKDSVESVREFQKAIQLFPGYYEAYEKLGVAELDLKQWDSAESAFRKSIELSSGRYPPASFRLGLILSTVRNQFAEAESAVRTGLAMDPEDVTGNFVLGWVLYSTGRLEEAEKSAREAILIQPDFVGARLLLARIQLREGKFSSVVGDLDAFLANDITSPWDAEVRELRTEALRALSRDKADSEIVEASH
jgi:tetratricopeptide (TPR) repeat protein